MAEENKKQKTENEKKAEASLEKIEEKKAAEEKQEVKEIPEEETGEKPVVEEQKTETKDVQTEESDSEKKESEKKKQPQKVVKKDEALVNGFALPISTKQAMAICKFIRGKRIGDAIRELEDVKIKRKAVPMKGEIPHKKGAGKFASGSGRYPKNASESFINLLKTLAANSNMNGMEEPIIHKAIANIASRPFGKGGRVRKKRTHVRIIAIEKKLLNKEKNGRKKSS
jgi:large subunit ribosomal protein L22